MYGVGSLIVFISLLCSSLISLLLLLCPLPIISSLFIACFYLSIYLPVYLFSLPTYLPIFLVASTYRLLPSWPPPLLSLPPLLTLFLLYCPLPAYRSYVIPYLLIFFCLSLLYPPSLRYPYPTFPAVNTRHLAEAIKLFFYWSVSSSVCVNISVYLFFTHSSI